MCGRARAPRLRPASFNLCFPPSLAQWLVLIGVHCAHAHTLSFASATPAFLGSVLWTVPLFAVCRGGHVRHLFG